MHHDNTRHHTAAQVVQHINNLGWELLSHPPDSSYLVSSDFRLFGDLKEFIRGSNFSK